MNPLKTIRPLLVSVSDLLQTLGPDAVVDGVVIARGFLPEDFEGPGVTSTGVPQVLHDSPKGRKWGPHPTVTVDPATFRAIFRGEKWAEREFAMGTGKRILMEAWYKNVLWWAMEDPELRNPQPENLPF